MTVEDKARDLIIMVPTPSQAVSVDTRVFDDPFGPIELENHYNN